MCISTNESLELKVLLSPISHVYPIHQNLFYSNVFSSWRYATTIVGGGESLYFLSCRKESLPKNMGITLVASGEEITESGP